MIPKPIKKSNPMHVDNTAKQFVIVRHGETANNKDGLNRGMIEVPLNGKGITGAYKVAQKLKGEKLDGVISSPLNRAVHTAKIISNETKTPLLETHEGLLPWHIGDLAGKKIMETLPTLHAHMDEPDKKLPNGESFNQFKKRTTDALADIRTRYPDKKLALITHHRVERLVEAHTSNEGGKGNFHLPVQKTKGIEPASHKVHNWKDMYPSKKQPIGVTKYVKK